MALNKRSKSNDRCYVLSKIFLIGFNILWWISGFLIVTVAAYLKFESPYAIFLGNHIKIFNSGLYIMLISGFLTILTGLLGWYSILTRNKTLLIWFCLILIGCLSLLLTITVWTSMNKSQIHDAIYDFLKSLISKFKDSKNKNSPENNFINKIQYYSGCCGLNGPTDYGKVIPKSCFNKTQGCFDKMKEYAFQCEILLATCGVTTSFLMIFGLIISIYFLARMRQEKATGEK